MKADSQCDAQLAPLASPLLNSVEFKLFPPYLAKRGGGRVYVEVPGANFGEGRISLELVPLYGHDDTWEGVLVEVTQHWPGLVEFVWLNKNSYPVHPRPIMARLQPYEQEIM